MAPKTRKKTEPICPLCGGDLSLDRSITMVVSSDRDGWKTRHRVDEEWAIGCLDGHVVSSGGKAKDGRSAKKGWRNVLAGRYWPAAQGGASRLAAAPGC